MIKLKGDSCNCPNCGSPINDAICSYCGTIIYDFANLDADNVSYIRLKFNDRLFVFKARLTNVNAEISNDAPVLYFVNYPVRIISNHDRIHITVEMDVIEDNDKLFLKVIKP